MCCYYEKGEGINWYMYCVPKKLDDDFNFNHLGFNCISEKNALKIIKRRLSNRGVLYDEICKCSVGDLIYLIKVLHIPDISVYEYRM